MRRGLTIVLLVFLGIAAEGSLAFGGRHALLSNGDLMRRAEEVALFLDRRDPFADPDMTYPPSAPPVFAVLVGPFSDLTLRVVWLVANVGALWALGWLLPKLADDDWPRWLRWAFLFIILAGKPGRQGLGLGQFHAIPLLLMILSVLLNRRPSAGRQTLAGLLLGIALIKPTLSLPLLVYHLVRHWRTTVVVALIVQVILCGITSLYLRVDPLILFREWVANARGQESAGLMDVPSLVANFLHLRGAIPNLLGLLVLLLGSALMVRFRRQSTPALFSLACGLAAIFTYHRPYDLVLLYPALAYCLTATFQKRLPLPFFAVFAILLIVPTDPFPPAVRPMMDGTFIVGSYVLLATCVVLAAREPASNLGLPSPPPSPA